MILPKHWHVARLNLGLGVTLIAMATLKYFVDDESPAPLLVLGLCNLVLGMDGSKRLKIRT
jgi:hypothetical protein